MSEHEHSIGMQKWSIGMRQCSYLRKQKLQKGVVH